MPHGVLTPLRKQLRSVLANLRPLHHDTRTLSTRPLIADRHPDALVTSCHPARGRRSGCESSCHASTRAESAQTAARAPVLTPYDDEQQPEATPEKHPDGSTSVHGARRRKRRRRNDYVTKALREGGLRYALPRYTGKTIDLSHWNVKRRTGRAEHGVNAGRHASDPLIDLAQSEELSLERITASCIRRQAGRPGAPFQVTESEASYIREKGFGTNDVQRYISIITEEDSYVAASMLANEEDTGEQRQTVPLFVLLHLLRRQHINASALRILLKHSRKHLVWRLESGTHIAESTVFTLFVRLVRHAREVWPAAMDSISKMLLAFLPGMSDKSAELRQKHLDTMTYLLNKAMHLLSLSTAVKPYEDVGHQELAIVRILRYMSEHKPSLQITRQGYRAVIRIQLAQKKTTQERQWAELKALSWPPWKEERTAMDALVTHTEHGFSRAANTLRQMREAGYPPLSWEKAAQLYTGWDIDGTPTIQTRSMLGSGSFYARKEAVWVARIATTRTAQEAWAAYLACEDAKLGHSDAVCLAVFKKLYEEEKRQRTENAQGIKVRRVYSDRRERILPGDAREIQPLPPSTHLYTYTRTQPPNVEDFFRQLRDRGVSLSSECTAFIVRNATSLQLGLEYLRTAVSSTRLDSLSSTQPADLQHRHWTVLTAYIELLCRHSNVPLNTVDDPIFTSSYTSSAPSPILRKERLNLYHPLERAISILNAYRPTYRPPWNFVLQAFSRDATLSSMRFLSGHHRKMPEDNKAIEVERNNGAILAYRLTRRVLSILDEMYIDLDIAGFHALCLAAEKMTIACWKTLRHDVQEVPARFMDHRLRVGPVHHAYALLRSSHRVRGLRGRFNTLVGYDPVQSLAPLSVDADALEPMNKSTWGIGLPPLLATPSPALLHAYTRALGWMADYDGLLALVKWMVRYRTELAEQRARESMGERMLHLTVVALRVFLERPWLLRRKVGQEDAVNLSTEVDPSRPRDPRVRCLRRLEFSAAPDLVAQVRELVEGVEDWPAWPTDHEVEKYCTEPRFVQIRKLY